MSSLPVRLADTLKQFGAQVAYGQEREIEGTTFVPVALVAYGFGGGGGDDDDTGGGGGGGYVIPVGAYVGDSLGVRFQANPVALAAVAIPLVWASGKALARIVKALKK
ncbi:hypothetical protein [uncultured Amnibacterium sp.]|uniref:hypothetical protein n=1 Tax=uncultured Amnibacterium sp. TaxID=1631851 RepID=UPI0035C9E918